CVQRGIPSGAPTNRSAFLQLPVFIDSTNFSDAEQLITNFGDEAGLEAANRADKSRALGNHLHYCKWRQVERLCVLLSIDQTLGTVH
ncbi:MAG: hypothetical protein AAGM33_07115, partial [Pseudomonadota bacterium]